MLLEDYKILILRMFYFLQNKINQSYSGSLKPKARNFTCFWFSAIQ